MDVVTPRTLDEALRLKAERPGARCILGGTYAWMVIVVLAMFLPRGNVVTFLTIGYMLARGLAKSGSHSRSSDND